MNDNAPPPTAPEAAARVLVTNPVGLHARPAVKLTRLAKQFVSDIRLRAEGQADWVNAKSPYKSAKDYIAAVKAAPNTFKMGGAGAKREDEVVTRMLEQATGANFKFIPYKGGGEITAQLVGGHIESDVNNPAEHVATWRSGDVRPLCVMDSQRMPSKEPIADGKSWNDVPTCAEQGIDAQYQMLRGIFMPKGVTTAPVAGPQSVGVPTPAADWTA